ncbi:MAG: DNA modification methylase, partial [Natronomonas sp.]
HDDDRYASAFFWEERNEWFSDCWEVRGTRQTRDADDGARERSGAFPLEIPLRLVRMYSVRGDTVLDPFAGTGTTSLAALLAGRSSLGVERDADLAAAFEPRVKSAPERSREHTESRLEAHRQFIADNPEKANYEAEHYDMRVVTKNERHIELPTVESVEASERGPLRYVATHESF